MKDLLNSKKILYVGICALVIGIAFAIGTYARYVNEVTGEARGQVLAYTCTENAFTNLQINNLTNLYPGSAEVRTLQLNASIYTVATITVSNYVNMDTGSVHPNLAIYNDENHINKMDASHNSITVNIVPNTTTNVPLYIYWPYTNEDETYNNAVPSATLTITCRQGVQPAS